MVCEKKSIKIVILGNPYSVTTPYIPQDSALYAHNQEVVKLLQKRRVRQAEKKIETIAKLFPENLLAKLNYQDMVLRKMKKKRPSDFSLYQFFPKDTYEIPEIIAYLKILYLVKEKKEEKKEIYAHLVQISPLEPILAFMEKELFPKLSWWKKFKFWRFRSSPDSR